MSVRVQVLGSGPEVAQLQATKHVASVGPAEWRVDPVSMERVYGPRAGDGDTYLVVYPNATDEQKRAVAHAMQCGDGGAELNNFVSPAALLEFINADKQAPSLLGCRLQADGSRLMIAGMTGLNGRRFPLPEWRAAYSKARGSSPRACAAPASAAAAAAPAQAIASISVPTAAAAAAAPVDLAAAAAASVAALSLQAAPVSSSRAAPAFCALSRCETLPDSLQQASLALVARVMRHVYPDLKVKLSSNRKRLIAPRDVSGDVLRAALNDACSLIASSTVSALRKEKAC